MVQRNIHEEDLDIQEYARFSPCSETLAPKRSQKMKIWDSSETEDGFDTRSEGTGFDGD